MFGCRYNVLATDRSSIGSFTVPSDGVDAVDDKLDLLWH